jgi:alkanesulfonate monooxygenase SsuD/methylene tetrahydromethanopterin reductase-like flavin-dependent oxidoreductase (luciferase family)
MQPKAASLSHKAQPHGLSFGIWLPPLASWPHIRDRWKRIEALGYDSLWVVDHFVNPYQPTSVYPWFEAWTLLAAMAAETERIRVGTLVTNIIYRNPALIAKQAMTVDHISQGRLTLGIGAGYTQDPSHPQTGVEAWDNRERVERFREIVEIVDHMLRQPVTTYSGRYYHITEAAMMPGPVQKPRPPLLIGAHRPRMLKIAAAYADTWSTLGASGSAAKEALELTRQRNEMLSEEAAALGRDPRAITRSLCVGWTPDTPFVSLEAFYDFIGRYREAGITEFIVGYWTCEEGEAPLQHISDEDTLERIALEAMPAL